MNPFEIRVTLRLVVIVIAAGLFLAARQAPAAEKGKTADAGKPPGPVSISKVAGTDVVRVTLQPEAAKRLDITTTVVREKTIRLPRTFPGEVVTITADRNIAIVRLELTEKDASRVRPGEPGAVFPLARDSKVPGVPAVPIKEPTRLGLHGPPGTIYFETSTADHGLSKRQLVLVELTLAGSGERRKVVPYGALLYDPQGRTWVYTSPAQYVFVRQRIDIDTIVGNEVLLRQGPAAGTAVVTVGVAELYGAEVGVGK